MFGHTSQCVFSTSFLMVVFLKH